MKRNVLSPFMQRKSPLKLLDVGFQPCAELTYRHFFKNQYLSIVLTLVPRTERRTHSPPSNILRSVTSNRTFKIKGKRDPRSGHVGFVENEVPLEQGFPHYFGFPYQLSFRKLLHTHLSVWPGTTGQIVADVPSGLSITPPPRIK
jgi:hypothetical protein